MAVVIRYVSTGTSSVEGFSPPLWTDSAAVYPYSAALEHRFIKPSRYGDLVSYGKVLIIGGKRYFAVPREMVSLGSEDRRVEGLSESFTSLFTPRNEDQAKAVAKATQLLKAGTSFVFEAPTGSGKTACAMALIASVGRKTLVIVTKEDIRDQWFDAAKKFCGLERSQVGLIQGNTFDVDGKPIVIAMIQSLSKDGKYEPGQFKDFGLVIQDECIAEGSPILMGDGKTEVSIEELVSLVLDRGANPEVMSFNEHVGRFEPKHVTHAWRSGVRKILEIRLDDGKVLRCTEDHRVYTSNRGWVEAKCLTSDDTLRVGGTDHEVQIVAKVVSIREVGEAQTYDLEVEGNHNFVASGVLVHNCHRVGSDQFAKAMWLLPAKLRLGLSATPTRKDGREGVVFGHIGKVEVRVSQLRVKPKIIAIDSGWEVPKVRYQLANGSYRLRPIVHSAGRIAHINKLLGRDPGRNNLIGQFVAQARSKGRTCIVFSDLRDHLDELQSVLRQHGIPASDIGFYVGGISKVEREVAKKKPIILATYAYTNEGTDIPWLDTLVLGTPRSDVIQIVGRVLREWEGKKSPVVLDILDRSSPVLAGYANTRLQWYNNIGAEVVIKHANTDG